MAETTTPDLDKVFTDYVAARAVYEPHNRAIQMILNEIAVKIERFNRKVNYKFWDTSELRKFRALEAYQIFGPYGAEWYVDADAKNIRFEVENEDFSEYFNVSWDELPTILEKLEEAYTAWQAEKAAAKAEAEKKKNAAAAAKARAEYEKFASAGYYN